MDINNINSINLSNKFRSYNINFGKTSNTSDNKKSELSDRIILGTGVALVLGVLAIRGIKRGWFSKKNIISTTLNCQPDNISYPIKPAKISHLTGDKYRMISTEFPLEAEYQKVFDNISEDTNTLKRYNEVVSQLTDVSELINAEFKKLNSSFNFFEGKNEMKHHIERSIRQKRYFSIEGNKQSGYSCLDPLLYRSPREEAIDTQLGYKILSGFQFGEKHNPLYDNLLAKFQADISNQDKQFIDICISKLATEDAVCCGNESKLHAYELSKIGKIFREAMKIHVN